MAFITQKYNWDCTVTALANSLLYLGLPVNYDSLLKEFHNIETEKNGVPISDILPYLKKTGANIDYCFIFPWNTYRYLKQGKILIVSSTGLPLGLGILFTIYKLIFKRFQGSTMFGHTEIWISENEEIKIVNPNETMSYVEWLLCKFVFDTCIVAIVVGK